jgi:hypothetical protein
VDGTAIERAMRRLAQADGERHDPAGAEVALERARVQVEALAQTTAELEASLPHRVGEAVREGIRSETLPVARQLAETRGLSAQAIRRLERIEGDMLAERHARLDDLALLVDLITAGWRGIDERLARMEHALATQDEPGVYSLHRRHAGA